MLYQNMQVYYENIDPLVYHANIFTNNCHVLGDCKAPVGIGHLLGLGSKFCPRKLKLHSKLVDDHISRLTKDLRTKRRR